MSGIRSSIAAIALACVSAVAVAQGSAGDPLAVGRKMLAEDNPGELWIDKGKQLFYEKRGPRSASLEPCDFGLGPGKLEGASGQPVWEIVTAYLRNKKVLRQPKLNLPRLPGVSGNPGLA